MAMYTGIASRLKVKKDAPQNVIDFLDYLYNIRPAQAKPEGVVIRDESTTKHAMGTVQSMLQLISTSFKTWDWRVKEEHEDFFLYESRGSTSYADENMFIMILEGIKASLATEEGDIVLFKVYEEAVESRVVFFMGGGFHTRIGIKYENDAGFITDHRHPTTWTYEGTAARPPHERREDDEELPWTVADLDGMAEKERKERERKLRTRFGKN